VYLFKIALGVNPSGFHGASDETLKPKIQGHDRKFRYPVIAYIQSGHSASTRRIFSSNLKGLQDL